MVVMLRKDLDQRRYPIHMDNLNEANQFLIEKRPNKITALQVSRVFTLHRLKVLPEMPKRLPLSYRRFVINALDSSDKFIIERHSSDDDASLGRAPNVFPRLLGKPIFPPVLERG